MTGPPRAPAGASAAAAAVAVAAAGGRGGPTVGPAGAPAAARGRRRWGGRAGPTAVPAGASTGGPAGRRRWEARAAPTGVAAAAAAGGPDGRRKWGGRAGPMEGGGGGEEEAPPDGGGGRGGGGPMVGPRRQPSGWVSGVWRRRGVEGRECGRGARWDSQRKEIKQQKQMAEGKATTQHGEEERGATRLGKSGQGTTSRREGDGVSTVEGLAWPSCDVAVGVGAPARGQLQSDSPHFKFINSITNVLHR